MKIWLTNGLILLTVRETDKLVNKALFVIAVLLFFVVYSCSETEVTAVEEDNDLYLHVLATDSSNFTQARFALHVPENADRIRAIFIIVPGMNYDGRSFKDVPSYKNFAEENNFAIISCFFQGDDYHEYWKAEGGSGNALKKVIEEFASRSERNELSTCPLIIWGHSAGGQFAFSFTALNPERVAACATVRSGSFTTSPKEGIYDVPVLFLLGEYDVVQWNETAINLCKINRRLGAKWTYAIEPEAGHEILYSNFVAFPFLRQSLDLRLQSAEPEYNNLIVLNETSGYLGNYSTFSVSSYYSYSGYKLEAAWLPDSLVADKWKNYCKGSF